MAHAWQEFMLVLEAYSLSLSVSSTQHNLMRCVGAMSENHPVWWPWRSFTDTHDLQEGQLAEISPTQSQK